MKKALQMMFLLVVMVCALCISAGAEELSGTCSAEGDTIYWTFDHETGALTLSGSGAMKDWENHTDTPWFSKNIEQVTIQEGITHIGSNSFARQETLKEVTLPKSLMSIGGNAFFRCNNIELTVYMGTPEQWRAIAIGEANGYLEYGDFQCIDREEGLITWNLDEAKGTLTISGVGPIEDYMAPEQVSWYVHKSKIKTVIISENITHIGSYAFYQMPNLTKITLPTSLKKIGEYAFFQCPEIEEIFYAGTETQWDAIEIEEGNNCIVNTQVQFPTTKLSGYCGSEGNNIEWELDGSTGILLFSGSGMMQDWGYFDNPPWYDYRELIRTAIIENGILNVGAGAFKESNLEDISLPNSVVSIGEYAFYQCKNLKSVILSDNTTNIGSWAFQGCSILGEINVPDNVISIGEFAFASCSSLKNIKIPSGLKYINRETFHGCSSIEYITIPDSVIKIGYGAFGYCTNMISIELPNSIKNIEAAAFRQCDRLTKVILPKELFNIRYSTFEGCGNLKIIGIPSGVTEIEFLAFNGCDNLRDVYYEGTEEDWENIIIGTNNHALVGVNIHYKSILADIDNGVEDLKPDEMLFDIDVQISYPTTRKIEVSLFKDGNPISYINKTEFSVHYANMSPGVYSITISQPGCLTWRITNIVLENRSINLGKIILVSGDVNNDGMINIMDMGVFRQNFGKMGSKITNIYTDINDDGIVNIADMGIFRQNFGKTAEKDCTVGYVTQQ